MGWGRHDDDRDHAVDIRAVDALNIVAMLLLAIIVAFFRQPLGEVALWLLATFATLVVLTALLAFLSSRGRVWRAVHAFAPAFVIIVVFNTLGPIIDCTSPARWDLTFARFDAALFGELSGAWRALLGRPSWFVDVAYGLYVSYYFVPVVLAVLVYRRERATEFHCLVFTVVLTFYLSYIGYFLFPTLGPRVPFEAEPLAIGGGLVSSMARSFIHFAERNQTDAFPSGHTAVGLVCVYLAWRFSAVLGALYLPLVTGIIFSTVYLHYHYVVDVLAGMAAGCAGAWLGPRLEPLCEPRAVMKRMAVRFGIE